MSYGLGFSIFVCVFCILCQSYLTADSFFPERTFSRTDPNLFRPSRWRNIFPDNDFLINPVFRNSQSDGLLIPDIDYSPLFSGIFNDTELFPKEFLRDGHKLQNNFDILETVASTDASKSVTEDVITEKYKGINENDRKNETFSEEKYRERNKNDAADHEENDGKNETFSEENYRERSKNEAADHEENDGKNEKEKESKTNIETTTTELAQDHSTVNFNDEKIKEESSKDELNSRKTISEDEQDEEKRISKDIKIKEVSKDQIENKETDENVKSNEDAGNTDNEKVARNEEMPRRNEDKNRKINLKTGTDDKEENFEKNKQIMSIENNEKQSESKKGKEETNVRAEKKNNEERFSTTNEMENEDTEQSDGSQWKITKEENEMTNIKNESSISQLEKNSKANKTVEINGKVHETLREALPDELSNSDLDVLQDNSTNFICLTDSSKCLSKSTSILLTTGILVGIIVGLVTVVGITTGLSVYIFHRWKLRKKYPTGKSNTTNVKRVFNSTLHRPIKKRSKKSKTNEVEINESPVNTLEAITIHNYREDRQNTHNL